MVNNEINIYKGQIIYTPTKDDFIFIENGYIVVKGSKVLLTIDKLPDEYKNYPVKDYGNKLIIPGFNDLHIHAAQFKKRASCLNYSLMDWLFDCIFSEEAKFNDIEYAKTVYAEVIKKLWQFGSTRSVIFTTIHKNSTKLLLDMLIESGLGAYVGKVNMDIKSPEYLTENTTQSIKDTEEIIIEYQNKSPLVKPIIAPRFVVSCSAELLGGLGKLAQLYNVPVMSHLSEDLKEIEIVKDRYPNFPTYGSIYRYFGLFGQQPTIMAHCVYSDYREQTLIKNSNVLVAHCPTSNCNLTSGMMPCREFLNKGIKVGFGTDIAGGGFVSMLKVMSYAMSVSRMVTLYVNDNLSPLTSCEVFYMATKGGGSFFGKVGSFEPDYDFDALIIDDSDLLEFKFTLLERIERLIHLGSHYNIIERYVAGKKINKPEFE